MEEIKKVKQPCDPACLEIRREFWKHKSLLKPLLSDLQASMNKTEPQLKPKEYK